MEQPAPEYESHEDGDSFEETVDLVYAFASPGCVPGQSGVVFAANSSGLMRSDDGGQTWQDALESLNLSEGLPVTSLGLSPAYEQDGTLLAGAPGGVLRTQDGGQEWRAVFFPPPPPTVSALAVAPNFAERGTAFAGTMEDGVFVTNNAGLGWTAWNFGLLDLNVICLAISPHFGEDETLFAGTETGIFRSTNGGRAWREVELPFGFEPVNSLAISPNFAEDGKLYAGTESQGLWVSEDEGDSWAKLGDFDAPINGIVLDGEQVLVVTTAALPRSAGGDGWQEALPQEYAERGISTLLAPQGIGPGKTVLVGFLDGSTEAVKLL